MTIATTPSLVKKSLFFIYLLNAPWSCLLLSTALATFVIAHYGAQIPDVPSMHSMFERAMMTQMAARIEAKDPAAIVIEKKADAIEQEKLADAKREALIEKQSAEIKKNSLIPTQLKNTAFLGYVVLNFIPWPVYIFGIALLISCVNGFWFLFHSFMKGLGWGFACIFVPFAATVFEFRYWQEVRRPFEIGLFCSCLFGICAGAYFGVWQYVPKDGAKISFADQISRFKSPPAPKMEITAPDIVSSRSSVSFFQAALAAVANTERGRVILKKMVHEKGKSFFVSFPDNEAIQCGESDLAVSNNRDILAQALETTFLSSFDVEDIRSQLKKTGEPAVAICLQLLTGKQTNYVKASEAAPDETAALVLDLLGRGMPVLVSAKMPKEIGSPQSLANSCYAIVDADVDTQQALLYNCRGRDESTKTKLPDVEDLGNGLVRVPFSMFPKYIRYIAYVDKW